jgi:cyclophilin family peptidyl-prolyl cis-trans isomerase
MKRMLVSAIALAALATCSAGAGAGPAANPTVEMVVAGRGKVILELYPKEAPKTVAHITDLIKKGFYNGIVFHRVVPNFVVQAGDPKSIKWSAKEIADKGDGRGGTNGLGDGGSGLASLPLEVGSLTHETGTLGMARSSAPDSGDSQFFINLKPNHSLDGGYCVFGRVLKGMDVVQKIRRGDRITQMKLLPTRPRQTAK